MPGPGWLDRGKAYMLVRYIVFMLSETSNTAFLMRVEKGWPIDREGRLAISSSDEAPTA